MLGRTLLPAIAVASACLGAAAAPRYVSSTGGNDAAAGGSHDPWKTLTHALLRFNAGDPFTDLYLASGTYQQASGETFPLPVVQGGLAIHGDPIARTLVRTGGGGGIAFAPAPAGLVGLVEDLALDGFGAGGAGSGAGLSNARTLRRVEVAGFAVGAGISLAIAGGAPGPGPGYRAEVLAGTLHDNVVGLGLEAKNDSSVQGLSVELLAANLVIARNRTGVIASGSCGGCPSLALSLVLDHDTVVGSADDGVRIEPGPGTTALGHGLVLYSNVIAFNGGYGVNRAVLTGSQDSNLFWSNVRGDVAAAGLAPTDLVGDPLFRDPALGDYHLALGSPGVDSGVTGLGYAGDRDGAPRPLDGDGDGVARVDRGAHERVGGDLRRADFAEADPPNPVIASAFPFGAANPATPIALRDFASADADTTPAILTRPDIPLAMYQLDPGGEGRLLAVKDRVRDSVRLHLR